MALIVYSEELFPVTRKKKANITFGKTGIISLSNETCKNLGLIENDKVCLLQDDEDTASWYVAKDDKAGYALRSSGGNVEAPSLIFNNKALCVNVCEDLGLDDLTSHTFKVATESELECEGLECFAILTIAENAKRKPRK